MTTANFVFQEAVTLIRYQLGWDPARQFGEALRNRGLAKAIPVSTGGEQAGWLIFLRYQDHRFSFVDCTSFAVMQRLRLDVAITLDDDFRSFGLESLP